MKITVTITDLDEASLYTLGHKLMDMTSTDVSIETPEINPREDFAETSNEDVSGEIDAEGLPWDARIHAGSKKKKADGTWTKRRNLDDAEYQAVKNELLSAPVMSSPEELFQQPAVFIPPQTFEQPATQIPPTVQPSIAPNTFQSLMARVQSGAKNGTMNQEVLMYIVQQVNTQLGISAKNMMDFINNQKAIDICFDIMNTMGI